MSDPFANLPKNHFGVVLADPPWRFETWSMGTWRQPRSKRAAPYSVMSGEDIAALPVRDLVADDAALFMWFSWPQLPEAMALIEAWGFIYKTCAFSWVKAHASQPDFFRDDNDVQVGLGYWTRANNESCLLATRGTPKRLSAAVRQAIIEPRREHSRKPDCVYERIERLVAGPYLELFARSGPRPGWVKWGNEVGKFPAASGAA